MECLKDSQPPKLDECLELRETNPKAAEPNPSGLSQPQQQQTELEVLCASSAFDATQVSPEDAERRLLALRHVLEKDIRAADLKWSLFVAACNTYRFDTCLRPFPPMYVKNDTKDIEALRKTVEQVPPLAVLVRELREPNVYESKTAVIELLFWVLVRIRNFNVKSVSKECHESVLKRVDSQMNIAPPNLIFQISSAKQSVSEENWKELSKGHSTFYAYHGSRLENFHSILYYGLQQHLCKQTSLFGKGIYLSGELGVSITFSPVGYSWGMSLLGSEMSCVALCEVINHPDVKIGDTDDNTRNIAPESIGGKIPKKYCVVLNNDLVRIRYLLVYSQDFGKIRSPYNSGLLGWVNRNKLLTCMLGYIVLLASVGLSHNKNVERYFRLLMRKFGLQY